jgi:hypothetical protein
MHIYGTIVGRLNPQEFYQLNNFVVLMNKKYLLLLDLYFFLIHNFQLHGYDQK